MTRYFGLILCLSCFRLLVSAQEPQAYRIDKDSLPLTPLDIRHWQILSDTSGKITADH